MRPRFRAELFCAALALVTCARPALAQEKTCNPDRSTCCRRWAVAWLERGGSEWGVDHARSFADTARLIREHQARERAWCRFFGITPESSRFNYQRPKIRCADLPDAPHAITPGLIAQAQAQALELEESLLALEGRHRNLLEGYLRGWGTVTRQYGDVLAEAMRQLRLLRSFFASLKVPLGAREVEAFTQARADLAGVRARTVSLREPLDQLERAPVLALPAGAETVRFEVVHAGAAGPRLLVGAAGEVGGLAPRLTVDARRMPRLKLYIAAGSAEDARLVPLAIRQLKREGRHVEYELRSRNGGEDELVVRAMVTTKVVVKIDGPRDGSELLGLSQQVTGTVSGSPLAKVLLRAAGTTVEVPVHGGAFAARVALRPGRNEITVDAAGEVVKVQVRVKACAVLLTAPAAGAVVDGDRATVEGCAGIAGVTQVTLGVNGRRAATAPVSGGRFTASVPLVPGKNTIVATAGTRRHTVTVRARQPESKFASGMACFDIEAYATTPRGRHVRLFPRQVLCLPQELLAAHGAAIERQVRADIQSQLGFTITVLTVRAYRRVHVSTHELGPVDPLYVVSEMNGKIEAYEKQGTAWTIFNLTWRHPRAAYSAQAMRLACPPPGAPTLPNRYNLHARSARCPGGFEARAAHWLREIGGRAKPGRGPR